METVSIHTTQNISIDYKLAGLMDRILAFLLDMAVISAYYLVTFMLGIAVFQGHAMAFIIINSIIAFLYFLLSEIFMDGQTLGKKALHIKVVKLDGSKPSVAAFLLRWVMAPIDFSLSGAVAIVLIIFTPNGQRLGDLVAGTSVVKLRKTDHTLARKKELFASIEEDYEPTFTAASDLSSAELQLIRNAIEAFRKSGQRRPVETLKQRMEEKLNIESNLPPIKFLHTLSKDHHYYASRGAQR